MAFHHDATLPQRTMRQPYGPADWICSIVYLTDVDVDSPAFAVVPRSVRYEPIQQAKAQMGEEYVEQALWGPAGTAVFYDTATCKCSLRLLLPKPLLLRMDAAAQILSLIHI